MHVHNTEILSSIPSAERIEIYAIDSVSGNVCQSLIHKIVSKLPTDESKTMGLQKKLVLGIGYPVEICVNSDTEDGLTNSTSCVVRYFDFRVRYSSRCSIIWVEFDDQNQTFIQGWNLSFVDSNPRNM